MLKLIHWMVATLLFVSETTQSSAQTSCWAKEDFNSYYKEQLNSQDFESGIKIDRIYESSHPGPFYLIDWEDPSQKQSEAIVVVNIFSGDKFISPNGIMTPDQLNERIYYFQTPFDGQETFYIDCVEVEHASFQPALKDFPNLSQQANEPSDSSFRVVYILFKRVQNQLKPSSDSNSVLGSFRKLPEAKRLRRYFKLYRSISYLHSRGIVHGHLAMDSLSLDEVTKDLKINDIRNYIKNTNSDDQKSMGQHTCSIYTPPEKLLPLSNGGLLERMDAYSFGMIIAAIEFDEPAIEGLAAKFCSKSHHNYIWTVSQNLKLILESHPSLGFNSNPVRENTLAALISECTNIEPSSRPEDPKVACRLTRLRMRTKGYNGLTDVDSGDFSGNLLDKRTDEEICENNKFVSTWSKNLSFGVYLAITIVGLAILVPIIYFYVIR